MRFIGRRFIITLAILAAVYGEKVIAVFFPRDDREFSVFFIVLILWFYMIYFPSIVSTNSQPVFLTANGI